MGVQRPFCPAAVGRLDPDLAAGTKGGARQEEISFYGRIKG